VEQRSPDSTRRGDRADRESSIADLGRRALTGSTTAELLEIAARDAAAVLGASRAAVLMVDGDELVCRAACGWPPSETGTVPFESRSQLAHTCLAQEPTVIDDLARETRFAGSRHLLELGLASAVAVPIRGGGDRAIGVLAAHFTDSQQFVDDEVVYLRSLANVLAAAFARERAEAASTRSREALEFLVEAGIALSDSSLDYDRTIERLAGLVVPKLADWCTIELEPPGGRRTVFAAHFDPTKAHLARALEQSDKPLLPRPATESGAVHVCDSQEELSGRTRKGALVAAVEALGMSSAIVVPLVARGRELGMLNLVRAGPERYDEYDLLYARELAKRAAVAVDNALLHASAIHATEQSRRLQEVTALLAEARTPHEIASAIVSSGARSVDAAAGWVAEKSTDGKTLELLASFGYEAGRAEEYRSISLEEHNPTTDAVAGLTPLFFRSAEEFRTDYPHVPYTRFEAMAVVPVVVEAQAIGVLALNFPDKREFAHEERQLLNALAKLYAQSLERAMLYENSRRREEATSLIARLSESMERATTVSERCRRAVSLLVHEFAEFAAIDLVDPSDSLKRVAAAVGDERWASRAAAASEPIARQAIARGGHQAVSIEDPEDGSRLTMHVLPLRARRRTSGLLTLGVSDGRTRYDAHEGPWLRQLTDHVALAIENASLYELEQSASRTLQLGLLGGDLPNLPEVELAAAYRPGDVTLEVGGDWYDAFLVLPGRLALFVGDVVGHDLDAAVAMGQLRGAARALAGLGEPAELLERLDGFAGSLRGGGMTTLAYLELDTASGGIRYACAGHPPPLVVPAAGEPRLLTNGRSRPLGVDHPAPREQGEDRLAAGDTIVLYTDGLVERKGENLALAIDRLAETAGKAAGEPMPGFLDRILREMLSGHPQEDDVCVIAGRFRHA